MSGAAHRDILGDSRSANCCILQYKTVAKIARGRSPKVAGCEMTILSSDILGYPRIIVESSLDWRKQFTDEALHILNLELRGRRSIC